MSGLLYRTSCRIPRGVECRGEAPGWWRLHPKIRTTKLSVSSVSAIDDERLAYGKGS